MTPDDRWAAIVTLVGVFLLTLFLIYLAEAILTIVRERPVVTKDPFTGDLQVVRSPNPQHRPRRHGRA